MAALYAAVDMSSLGEIYGMPPRRVTDKRSALDLIEMLLAKGADVNAKLKRATLMRNHTPGEGTLGDGATALMYSRIRHPDSDFARMRRQQAVLAGVLATLRQHATG